MNYLLNIKIPKRIFHNCFEAVLGTIAFWKGRNYELIYLNVWDFKFNLPKAGTANRLGNSLMNFIDVNAIMCKDLNLYYGIKYRSYKGGNFKDLINILSKQFLNSPVVVGFDTFYCPWDKSYQQNHNFTHVFLINGLDTEKKVLYCTDPFYKTIDYELSFENFLQGYTGYYGIFQFYKDKSKDLNIKELLYEAINLLFEKNIFEAIRNFAVEVNKFDSVVDEMNSCEENWQTPLFWNISLIVNNRKRISTLLMFLSDYFGFDDFKSVITDLHAIIQKWDLVKMLVLKLLAKKDISEIKAKLVILLYDIAAAEEVTAEKLIYLTESKEN